MSVRPGVRLGVDWGKARIGVAACDREAILCFPVETIAAKADPIARLLDLVREYQPIELILGMPKTLAGDDGPAAEWMRGIAAQIQRGVPDLPLRLVDERLSTVSASTLLRQAGRDSRSQRAVIDQAAAVAILENAIEYERGTGQEPGELFSEGLT
ncbi:MAG: Holliday junction resolvase RuvX, partial [Propionibacteriaceae bacterium]|nr:Holliday junction resolvase RuvX [Propionibacteriaceae bacterium]